jgi:DNA-directed RNA polymerase subunit RPC12/RpoP
MIRNFLSRLMIGRNGPDQLAVALIVASLVVGLLTGIVGSAWFRYASYILLALALWRMMSRNISRRRAENDKFIRVWWPIRSKISRYFSGFGDRKAHRFFKCPSCKSVLRLPKGKGKLQITCPKCGERFIKKT